MDPVVSPEQLLSCLRHQKLRLVDCRFELSDRHAGYDAYLASHLPGAAYLDLESDLSDPVGQHGGRHPLPNVNRLATRLGQIGIDNQSWVVAYDDRGDMAARFWWILRYLGHDAVQILDGGYKAWLKHGGPISTAPPTYPRTRFVAFIQDDLLVHTYKSVTEAATRGTLVDSRAGARYRGDHEPIDKIPGHIPGALNLDWQKTYGPDGRLRSTDQLRRRFAHLSSPEPVVYCGSGVTAAANILAMTRLGWRPKLYAGSWSDWISYPDRPIATGPEHPDPES